MKKILVFDDNAKVIENQLKTIKTITFSIFRSEPTVENILENKPNLIIFNQSNMQGGLKKIVNQSNPFQIILITESGPEKQTFEAWSGSAHIVRKGNWEQLKLTVKEVLFFFD